GGQTLTYASLTGPIADTVTVGTLVVNGTSSAETINVVKIGKVNNLQASEVNSGSSNTFTAVDFANKTAVTVNGNGGADSFSVLVNLLFAIGLTGITLTGDGTAQLSNTGLVSFPD